jgi:hypothetical protein
MTLENLNAKTVIYFNAQTQIKLLQAGYREFPGDFSELAETLWLFDHAGAQWNQTTDVVQYMLSGMLGQQVDRSTTHGIIAKFHDSVFRHNENRKKIA